MNQEQLNVWKSVAQKSDGLVRIYAEDLLAIIALAERALLAAAPAPIQQDSEAPARQALHTMQYEDGRIGWYFDCDGHYIDVEKDDAGKYSVYFRDRATGKEGWLDQADSATPPALAGSQVQAAGDEVNEREAFEAMVKERFVTTEHSLARAHPYGYYNTVSSDTFGGRRQPDYANVQMLWDVWDARATIAKKAMREQP